MKISKKLITKALIRLRGCAGWSAPVLLANPRRQVFSRCGPYKWLNSTKFWLSKTKVKSCLIILLRQMEFPIKFDTVKPGWFIILNWGITSYNFTNKLCSFSEDWLYLSKQCWPWWNATSSGISSGSSLFAEVPIWGFPVLKGLKQLSILYGTDRPN